MPATGACQVQTPTDPDVQARASGAKDAWDAFVDDNWADMLDAAYGSSASWKQAPSEVSAMVMALVQQRPGFAGTPITSLPKPMSAQVFGDPTAAAPAVSAGPGGQGQQQQQPLQQAIQTAELMQEVLRSVLGAADRTLQALQENGAGLLQGTYATESAAAQGAGTASVVQVTVGSEHSTPAGTLDSAHGSAAGAAAPRAWPLDVLSAGVSSSSNMPAGSSTYELFDVLQQELQQRLTIVASRISGGTASSDASSVSISAAPIVVGSTDPAAKPVVAHAIMTSATSSSGSSEVGSPRQADPDAAASTQPAKGTASEMSAASSAMPAVIAAGASTAAVTAQAGPQLPQRQAKRRSSNQRPDVEDAAAEQVQTQALGSSTSADRAAEPATPTQHAAANPVRSAGPTGQAAASSGAGTASTSAASSSAGTASTSTAPSGSVRPERGAAGGASSKALPGKRAWDAETLAMMPVEMQQAWQKILDHLGSSDEHGRWGDLMEQMIAQFKPHMEAAGNADGGATSSTSTSNRVKAGKQKGKAAKKGTAAAAAGAPVVTATTTTVSTATATAVLASTPAPIIAVSSGNRVVVGGSEIAGTAQQQADGSIAGAGKRERGSDGPSILFTPTGPVQYIGPSGPITQQQAIGTSASQPIPPPFRIPMSYVHPALYQSPMQLPPQPEQQGQGEGLRTQPAAAASGTMHNLQDLKLVAPGLQAAAQALARHPLLHALTMGSPIQLLDVSIGPTPAPAAPSTAPAVPGATSASQPIAGSAPAASTDTSGNEAGASSSSQANEGAPAAGVVVGEGGAAGAKPWSIRSFRQVLDGADEVGRVPLHAAVVAGRTLVVEQLLFMGADINKRLPADLAAPGAIPAGSSLPPCPSAPCAAGTVAVSDITAAPSSPSAAAVLSTGAAGGAKLGESQTDVGGKRGRDSLDATSPRPPSHSPSPDRARSPDPVSGAAAAAAAVSPVPKHSVDGGQAQGPAHALASTAAEPAAVAAPVAPASPSNPLTEARQALARAREKHQRAELIHQMVRKGIEKQAGERAQQVQGQDSARGQQPATGTQLPPLPQRTQRATPAHSLLGPRVSLKEGTALHLAVYHGHGHVLDVLLSNPLLDAGARTVDGLTALHVAAAKGDTQMVTRCGDGSTAGWSHVAPATPVSTCFPVD